MISIILDQIKLTLAKDYKNPWTIEGGVDGEYIRLVAERILRLKETNNRSMDENVRSALKPVFGRQIQRLLKHDEGDESVPDPLYISRGDIIGFEPDISKIKSKAWDELQEMVGMEEVKASLKSFCNGLLVNFHRELHGKRPLKTGLSRVFIGPPGTGKTTVAKIYGQILSDFNILSSGEVVVKNASHFIGQYIGQSEKFTKEIIEEARGKVLLIDEAYMLNSYRSSAGNGPCPYRQGVLDTIVGEVQNTADDNICVIMCGYKEEMENMLQVANPGLARRFPLADAFYFKEFDDSQLEMVLDLKMKQEETEMTSEAKRVAMENLRLAKLRPNFGNGGEVVNMMARAMANYRTRFGDLKPEERTGDICFLPEDIDPNHTRSDEAESKMTKMFEDFVGLDSVVDKLRSLARQAASLRKRKFKPELSMPFQFVFKGPPGSGKTTTARKLGSIYYNMGLLPTEEVLEVSTLDMVADHVGGTRTKTRKLMEQAVGKVLFIDEAYRLFSSDQDSKFSGEARDELIDAITKPELRNKSLIILAGYDMEMDKLLSSNPGFRGRFRTQFKFPSLDSDVSYELLIKRLKQSVDIGAFADQEKTTIRELLEALQKSEGWANGRDIESISYEIVGQVFEKDWDDDETPTVIANDVMRVLRSRLPPNVLTSGRSDIPDAELYD
ncbi:P-loop containing nucleoside triphosphate hydrolase protein [Microthyrium microscopicum]|uniref:P-loop containing nucleoside triphosphate hydrolase protein n=1 Tax=Microthyrium microscopicum TaxID=703497 RepID=A0A6A6UTW7_9PEZI|nr:P-loop containing nucleoside triphosphate hydrolase protein [Microthyrium microscopicum]